jgi:hypothetical protein
MINLDLGRGVIVTVLVAMLFVSKVNGSTSLQHYKAVLLASVVDASPWVFSRTTAIYQ